MIKLYQESASISDAIFHLSVNGVIYGNHFELSLGYLLWNDSGSSSSSFAKFDKERFHSIISIFI